MSHPVVHPMEVEVQAGQQPQVRMDDVPGKPGTLCGLGLRCAQFICASITLSVMANTHFRPFPSFRFVIAAVGLLFLWSLVLALLDIYALLAKRHLRHPLLSRLFSVGDGITAVTMYSAACMSGAVSRFFSDSELCTANHCVSYVIAIAFAFLGCVAISPSFVLNLSSWMAALPH
ncbi:CASP-like protein 5A1 [Triticum aestivum]|uniref:CASP-like protein 5A1 n=1 Tax=Triticum aestivum TaxID=4565 RepID=UPI0008424919|nr:CASP-like protein 5A1 [Triticum aestivum]XP_044354282.1 CASP-like protein 5A1 [Triticum aestivum]